MEKDVPVFIKIEEYSDVQEIVSVIKKKLDETKETLLKIHQLREEESQELRAWEQNLRDVHEKIEFVDQTVRQPRF